MNSGLSGKNSAKPGFLSRLGQFKGSGLKCRARVGSMSLRLPGTSLLSLPSAMFPRQPRLVVFCQIAVSIWREVERFEPILRSCSGRVRILTSFDSVVAFMFFSSQSLRLSSVEGIKLRIYVISQDKKSRLSKLGL